MVVKNDDRFARVMCGKEHIIVTVMHLATCFNSVSNDSFQFLSF